MPSASIEEAVQETQGVENSKSSMASNSNSASEAGDGAAPASASQADVIEQLDDEGEEEESPKSGENGDISAAEKQPLKPSDEKPGPSTGSVENVIGDEEEAISKDDLDSDDVTIRKKGWDIRCVIVGILILIIMVGGATAAILVHRFKGKPVYEFRFASYYNTHMVLQRAPHRASVWGYGPYLDDNTTVRLTVEGDDYTRDYFTTVRSTASGPTWKVILDEMTDHGPFKLTAYLEGYDDHVVSIEDVLFGDVWVCAGQENMRYPVDKLDNGTQEIEAASDYPSVRIFSVFPAKSDRLWYDLRGVEIDWSIPDNESLAGDGSDFSPKFSALCWVFGRQLQRKLQYPVGLIVAAYEESFVQDWSSAMVAKTCRVPYTYSTARLWNAMINPLLDLSIYGLIWYQGEADAPEMSAHYNCSLVEMIKEWRNETYTRTQGSTDPNFPVGIVQLAPNKPGDHLTYGYTGIRWRQTANYGFTPNELLPKTFLAVTIDLPDANVTHGSLLSKYKHVVSDRLLRGALALGYQQRVAYQGPFPARYQIKHNDKTMVLYFESGSIEKRVNDGFEVCCSENRSLSCPSLFIETSYAPGRKWVITPIKSHSSASVTLSLSSCTLDHVVGLRYAWRESPCKFQKCAIYGSSSRLPMPPYINVRLEDDGVVRDLGKNQVDLV